MPSIDPHHLLRVATLIWIAPVHILRLGGDSQDWSTFDTPADIRCFPFPPSQISRLYRAGLGQHKQIRPAC